MRPIAVLAGPSLGERAARRLNSFDASSTRNWRPTPVNEMTSFTAERAFRSAYYVYVR